MKEELALGVYLHVPFCSHLCHYCDFAKTARWDSHSVGAYFQAMERQLQGWIEALSRDFSWKVSSLYLGGGTPGLFTREYQGLWKLLEPHMASDVEKTLELNPRNAEEKALIYWRDLGLNRLSLGVQSFQEKALSFLKRDHSPLEAKKAGERIAALFENWNLDLIYAWQGQDEEGLHRDLEEALALNPTHMSLYCLSYEKGTPLGRARDRGKIFENTEFQAHLYHFLCRRLQEKGWKHEELSNWARPGRASVHNRLYWKDAYFLGVGVGAHGYLPGRGKLGWRYAYPKRIKPFLEASFPKNPFFSSPKESPWEIEICRKDSWLLEYLGCALRYEEGCDLKRIRERGDKLLSLTPFLKEALAKDRCFLEKDYFRLPEEEWFCEHAWAHLLEDALKPV